MAGVAASPRHKVETITSQNLLQGPDQCSSCWGAAGEENACCEVISAVSSLHFRCLILGMGDIPRYQGNEPGGSERMECHSSAG